MRTMILLAPLFLVACASEEIGPSLAKRPVEGGSFAEPARTITPPPAASAELQEQIAELLDGARVGRQAFSELLPRAREAAAAAGTEGSESWIAAQQLLSALEAARAPSTRSLAELDSLLAFRLNTGSEAGLVELQAAVAEVAPLVQGQHQDIEQVRARITR